MIRALNLVEEKKIIQKIVPIESESPPIDIN